MLFEWLFTLGMAALVGAGLWLRVRELHREWKGPGPQEWAGQTDWHWDQAATELGLEPRRGGPRAARALVGRAGSEGEYGLSVTQLASSQHRRQRLRDVPVAVELDGDGLIPREVVVVREGPAAAVAKAFAGEDVLVGDTAFDSKVRLSGPEEAVVAMLGAAARQAVLDLVVREQGEIRGGAIRLELPSLERDRLRRLSRNLELAAGFLAVRSVSGSLRANAAEDPEPPVRLRNLELLARKFPGSPDCAAAAAAALGDPSPELRLRGAAVAGGGEGLAMLCALALDPALPVSLRQRAAGALGEKWTADELAPVASRLLGDRDEEIRLAALGLVEKVRIAAALPDLCALPADSARLAWGVARALGAIGGEPAERRLTELLGHPATDVRTASALALGEIGSVRAVEPLLAAVPTTGDAAREAVRRIQTRIGDADAGRLSVVVSPTGADGALSVSAAPVPVPVPVKKGPA